MGGVKTDLEGRTSLRRLFAAGEVACTGVHGANRLASNSLLEGCVFGERAGRSMLDWTAAPASAGAAPAPIETTRDERVRSIASQYCGIIRDGAGLQQSIEQLHALPPSNMSTVAGLIASCALAREESRGGHFRSDYPEKRPEFARHSSIRLGEHVRFG
jgi:L-aspartate oxidase